MVNVINRAQELGKGKWKLLLKYKLFWIFGGAKGYNKGLKLYSKCNYQQIMFWKLLLRFNSECYRTVFLEAEVLSHTKLQLSY